MLIASYNIGNLIGLQLAPQYRNQFASRGRSRNRPLTGTVSLHRPFFRDVFYRQELRPSFQIERGRHFSHPGTTFFETFDQLRFHFPLPSSAAPLREKRTFKLGDFRELQ